MADDKKNPTQKKPIESALRTETTAFGVKVVRSKGTMPASLKGLYTDEATAERAIKSFYNQRIR